jgi:hypothetical protein
VTGAGLGDRQISRQHASQVRSYRHAQINHSRNAVAIM